MGVFEALRVFFDRGGIGAKLELPRKFAWADGGIPAVVTLTGHKTEPRLVNEIRFIVIDAEKSDSAQTSSSNNSGASVRVVWDYNEPIELAAGASQRIEVRIPLPAPSTREETEQEVFGRQSSGLFEKAFVAAVRGVSPTSISRFKVTIEAEVEGATKPKRTSKHIKQGSGHTFGAGSLSVKI